MEKIKTIFDEYMVVDYVISFRDVDGIVDSSYTAGSYFWQHGAAWDVLDHAKENLRNERRGLPPVEDTESEDVEI